MTFWELARVLARYWVVLIAGAVVTAAVGFVAVRADGVYTTRVELVLLAPSSTLYPNSLRTQSEDLIITAGVVAKRVSGPGQVTKFASPDVTLVGIGVRDGWSLRVPDTGGQWAPNFTSQVIILDVVGPTAEAVEASRDEVIGRVQASLYELQRDAGVDPANDITVLASPESTAIYYVAGDRKRTLAMIGLLGMGMTVSIVILMDRRRRPTRASRTERSMPNSRGEEQPESAPHAILETT